MRIIKIPFDLGIINKDKRGASKAPDIISKKGVTVTVSEDFAGTHEAIHEEASKGDFIALGGDHSITYGLAQAFKERHPNSCLIILDAHSDCEDDFIPPSHEGVVRAIATTSFSPKDIMLVGYRSARTTEEKEFIRKYNLKHINSNELESKSQEILDFVKQYTATYLSIDIGIFDSKDAPGTSWPEPNGPKKELIISLIKNLQKTKKVKSLDIVEVSPPFDKNKKTVSLAIDLLQLFTTPKA